MKRKKAIAIAACLLGIILLGVFIFYLASDASLQRLRSNLLQSPQPLPAELAKLYPAPGSHISASEFNDLHVVYLETYGNPLGIELGQLDADSVGRFALLINKVPIGPRLDVSQMETLRGLQSRLIWHAQLPPGDYLAELKIDGVDSELTYSWAFQITND